MIDRLLSLVPLRNRARLSPTFPPKKPMPIARLRDPFSAVAGGLRCASLTNWMIADREELDKCPAENAPAEGSRDSADILFVLGDNSTELLGFDLKRTMDEYQVGAACRWPFIRDHNADAA